MSRGLVGQVFINSRVGFHSAVITLCQKMEKFNERFGSKKSVKKWKAREKRHEQYRTVVNFMTHSYSVRILASCQDSNH